MLTVVFGKCTMSRTHVQFWQNRFKEGQEDVNDDARPGRPSTSTTDEKIVAMKKMILDNRLIIIRELADGSCRGIFMDFLAMKRAAWKIIPKIFFAIF